MPTNLAVVLMLASSLTQCSKSDLTPATDAVAILPVAVPSAGSSGIVVNTGGQMSIGQSDAGPRARGYDGGVKRRADCAPR